MTRTLAVVVAVAVLSSGCLGGVADGDFSFTASEVSVRDGAVAETGFEIRNAESIEVDRSVDVGGATRQVTISSHVVILRKEYGGAPTGHAVVLSTPKAGAFGQGLNPLGFVGEEELVSRIVSRTSAGGIEGLNRSGNRSVRILGADRTVSVYAARGENGDVRVVLTRFAHGDDYIVGVGITPAGVSDGTADVLGIFRGVEHGT